MNDSQYDEQGNSLNESAEHKFEKSIPKITKKSRSRGEFSPSFTPRPDLKRTSNPSGVSQTPQNFEFHQEMDQTPHSNRSFDSVPPPSPPKSHPTSNSVPQNSAAPDTHQTIHAIDAGFERFRLLLLLVVFVPLTIYSFWMPLSEMVYAWSTQVDYGHGFFVVPLVAFFLWSRLDNYPSTRYKLTWMGIFPILLCATIRYFAALEYMDALDQISLLFWILGLVWFFYGNRVFWWALPSLSFLIFMFQLPWRFEILLKNYLQQFAAQFAAILLQLIGEPAIPIKNTIRLSSQELGVEAACSGIRFLISILAIAFAAILLMRRPWWQNMLVIIIAAPLALFVNAARIALTGILLENFNGLVSKMTPDGRSVGVVADEFSGYVMIVVAISLFFSFLWYLGKVFRKVEL
ncbi:MAG: exosortase/archaeosortase family protein [Thermoguttaceae bacterium]